MNAMEQSLEREADAFRASAERAMKKAYDLYEPKKGLTLQQFCLAIFTGALTAAVAEAARLQACFPQDLGLLASMHKQVDDAWSDAMRMLSEGAS